MRGSFAALGDASEEQATARATAKTTAKANADSSLRSEWKDKEGTMTTDADSPRG
jgi:hypothetical protein